MINPELLRNLQFHNEPTTTPTSDMTDTELVEAGETDGTYISHDEDGNQVVIWPE